MASAKNVANVLVTLIKFLAGFYSIPVVAKRDSPDEEVRNTDRPNDLPTNRYVRSAHTRGRPLCQSVFLWVALWRGQHLAGLLPRDYSSFGISKRCLLFEPSHPLKSRMGSAYGLSLLHI